MTNEAPKKTAETPKNTAQGRQAQKTSQAKSKPQPKTQNPKKDDSINNEGEWNEIRQKWTKEQASRMKAHALRAFDTDDDMPLSKHLLMMTIILFWLFLLFWASMSPLDEVTRGEGKIIPSSEVQALQSLDAGIVEEFLVKEGDPVEKGQVLVRLNAIEADSDLGANQARYLGLLASITRLQAEAEGKSMVEFPENVMKGAPQSVTEELNTFRANRAQIESQTNIYRQQMMQREQEVRELNTRIADTRGIISLQREEKAMVEPLVARGSAPKLELLQLERTISEKTAELNGYLSSLPRAKSAVNEAKAGIDDIQSAAQAQAQAELSAKLIEMNEIKERLSALTERKTRTEIKSPVYGTIQELTVNTVGGVVRPGEDLIKIVPRDDKLIVEARVNPKDRAFIYPGQKAIVKLTAYDFSIYGGLEAELISISADTFEDEKGNSYYLVRLRTKETELKRKGEVLPIEVGMVATADILTGKKTVLQYLLKPFNKTLEKAMRER